MSDQPDNATLAALQALLAQQQAQGAPAPGGWNQPAPRAQAECMGVSVPISLETPAGKIRLYLAFPGSCAASPDALMALVQQLQAAGLPLDAWQPRDSGGGGSWGGNSGGNGGGWNRGNGGGFGGNRGGWRR